MRQWVKRVAAGVASLGLAASMFLTVVTLRTKLPGEEMTPAGIPQSSALYLKMRDGIEIAVSINLPQDLQKGERVPVLMRTTRYWREPQIGWLLRTLTALRQVLAREQEGYEQEKLRSATVATKKRQVLSEHEALARELVNLESALADVIAQAPFL